MKIIKLLILIFFCGLMLFGCLPDEKPNCTIDRVDGDPKNILGTWQLVSKRYINQETGADINVDFSCDGVFYQFLANGKFIVSGSNPEMPKYASDSYEFIFGGIKDEQPGNSTLRLSQSIWPCLLESNRMVIDDRYVDGEKLVFYRVNDFTDI